MKYVHEPVEEVGVFVLNIFIFGFRLSYVTTYEFSVVPCKFNISPYFNDDAQVLEFDWNFRIVTYEGSSNSGGKPRDKLELTADVGIRKK